MRATDLAFPPRVIRWMVDTGMIPLLLAAAAIIADRAPARAAGPAGATDAAVRRSAAAAFGHRPLHFEKHPGPTPDANRFVARSSGYQLALSAGEAALTVSQSAGGPAATLRMTLARSNPRAAIAGVDELPGKVHYFTGSDPRAWRTNVATFAKVRYTGVYPGIDMVHYGRQRQLEFDFELSPGADPDAIRLAFAGHRSIALGADGDLVLTMADGEVRLRKPISHQTVDGRRRDVASRFVLLDDGQVGFELGAYDASAPLVIDPVLDYATYLGGLGDDGADAVAVDADGNAYVAGWTTPAPIIEGHDVDAFVSKLSADGTALVYTTYVGGSSSDWVRGIGLDAARNVYISGFTYSTDFPVLNPFQPTHGGGTGDFFVAKIDPAGASLAYSTFVGGSGPEEGGAIAVDAGGSVYLTGFTQSSNFPLAGPIQAALSGYQDAVAFKLHPSGATLVYSTYLGGSHGDEGEDIAVDADGRAVVVGFTRSTAGFPLVNALQRAHGGGQIDAFVLKLNAAGSALDYSTYLGGAGGDNARAVCVDGLNRVHVGGYTSSPDFPVVNAVQPALADEMDTFIASISANGSALAYSTYLGGTSTDEQVLDMACSAEGSAYVTGVTSSRDFPVVAAVQPLFGDRSNAFGIDGFVAKLAPAGAPLLYSTYLGGPGYEWGQGIAVDSHGNAYVVLETFSRYLPTTRPVQPTLAGDEDAFVFKIADAPRPGLTVISMPFVRQGATVAVELTGMNFVDGSTLVTVSGAGVSVGAVTVAHPSSLSVTLTVAPDAALDSRDVVVTTPNGQSNRLLLHIVASPEACHVSLPVRADGGPFDARLDFAIAPSEPTTGLWVLGVLRYDGSQFTIDGHAIADGTLQPLAYPITGRLRRPIYPPGGSPGVFGAVNAFYNPNLCAFNVAVIPDAPPELADRMREEFEKVIGLPPGAAPMAGPR